ncbi:Uma2 family endonuclease [Actinoallomurus rhizosphaericola]|uniref:Uma2 family endonuclease n=1 Tax=Actinoallomurus rhizosphaericola TaxID=2952536 RepID=UPI0020909FD2|nr:Uma2 family endonuclease [Actinoallomurus rhizosphaericola]MCO5993538.1 Uma2 family endonuclease [Actinoallomurus rhizosphaericola]
MTEAFAMPPDHYRTSWTIEEVLALPENGMRQELIEGRLVVSPVPPKPHQWAAKQLERLFDAAAPPGTAANREVNLQLGADLLIPDVMVASVAALSDDGSSMNAADVTMVAEILSPGNTAFGRAWKSQRYAEGGVPFFMEVELSGIVQVTVAELRGRGYAKIADAHAGEMLKLAEPFELSFDPAELVGPRR